MRRGGSVKERGVCTADWPREAFRCFFPRCWRWLCRRNRRKRKTKRERTRPYAKGEFTMKTPIRRGLVLAVTTLLVALAGIAQQVPDTAAEKQFSAWLAAFNNGDRATLLQYLEKNYPQRVGEIDGVMEF